MDLFKTLFNKINKEHPFKFSIYLTGYLNYLLENKYKTCTIYHYMDDICDFVRYIHTKGIINLSKVSPTTIKQYLKYRYCMFKRKYKKTYRNPQQYSIIKNNISKFMTYLSMKGIIKSKYFIRIPKEFITKVPSVFHKVVKEYIDLYLTQRGIKPTTLSNYKYWILRFLNFLQHKGIKDISLLKIFDIDEFMYKNVNLHSHRFSYLSRSSINSIKGVLRSFCSFLYMYDYIRKDLSRDIFASKTYRQTSIPKHISCEEILSILKSVDRTTVVGKRDYAILVLLANYGLRPSEVAKLNVNDIDFKTNKIYITNNKSNKDLVLPLTEDVSENIKEYLKDRPDTNRAEIFVNLKRTYKQLNAAEISKIVKYYINRAGLKVPLSSAYLFRHSLAKHLLNKGVDIISIGSILGHSCISSTMQYLKINTEELRDLTDNYANLL